MSDVEQKIDGEILRVTLNRPDKLNAFTPAMIKSLTQIFAQASKNKKLRAVVLSGAGASFCAGADLNWMKSMVDFKLSENKADAVRLHDMFKAIKFCSLPVLGRVQGSVFGGGLGLVSVCDVVVAETSAQFSFSEVRLGLVPAVISPFVLQKARANKAHELMLTGRIFDSQTAFDAGLVEFVGRELEMKKYMDETLKFILSAGPEAVRDTKMMLQKLQGATLTKAKQITVDTIARKRISKEGQEGMRCVLEKRKPSWVKKQNQEEE